MNKGDIRKDNIRSIIHDLKNPINTISMNAELGLMLLEHDLDKQRLTKILQVVLQQCSEFDGTLSKLRELD